MQSFSFRLVMGHKPIPRECGLANYPVTVSLYSAGLVAYPNVENFAVYQH